MEYASRLRRHSRQQLDARVRVSWVQADGLTPTRICRSVDISESGIRVLSPEPIPLRQYVNFHVDGIRLSGAASVRSCSRVQMKYLIGLEFSGGTRWTAAAAPAPPSGQRPG